MTEQEKRIGNHPISGVFKDWLNSEDLPSTDAKKHRKLSENISERDAAVEVIARWIIQHHITDKDMAFLQKCKDDIYNKYDFKQRLKGKLPVKNESTQKGNASEIIFCEYVKSSTDFTPLVFRLRYNTNVEQSMKGDDLLLFDTSNFDSKILVGESKFRKIPDKTAIEEILASMGGEIRLPISMSFVESRLRDCGNDDLSDKLADLQIKVELRQVPITNIGFFLSNSNAANHIENHHLKANFTVTDTTIIELSKTGFPSQHITSLKSKIYKTESLLIDAIKKKLEKEKTVDTKNVIEKHQNSIFDHCDKSHNSELVFISLGIEEPDKLIERSFQRANEILKDEIETVTTSS